MPVVKFIDDNGNVVNCVDKDGNFKMKEYGSIVSIDGTDYRMTGDNTLRGLAADKPSAAAAADVVGIGVYYESVDTQVLEQSDGTNWVGI